MPRDHTEGSDALRLLELQQRVGSLTAEGTADQEAIRQIREELVAAVRSARAMAESKGGGFNHLRSAHDQFMSTLKPLFKNQGHLKNLCSKPFNPIRYCRHTRPDSLARKPGTVPWPTDMGMPHEVAAWLAAASAACNAGSHDRGERDRHERLIPAPDYFYRRARRVFIAQLECMLLAVEWFLSDVLQVEQPQLDLAHSEDFAPFLGLPFPGEGLRAGTILGIPAPQVVFSPCSRETTGASRLHADWTEDKKLPWLAGLQLALGESATSPVLLVGTAGSGKSWMLQSLRDHLVRQLTGASVKPTEEAWPRLWPIPFSLPQVAARLSAASGLKEALQQDLDDRMPPKCRTLDELAREEPLLLLLDGLSDVSEHSPWSAQGLLWAFRAIASDRCRMIVSARPESSALGATAFDLPFVRIVGWSGGREYSPLPGSPTRKLPLASPVTIGLPLALVSADQKETADSATDSVEVVFQNLTESFLQQESRTPGPWPLGMQPAEESIHSPQLRRYALEVLGWELLRSPSGVTKETLSASLHHRLSLSEGEVPAVASPAPEEAVRRAVDFSLEHVPVLPGPTGFRCLLDGYAEYLAARHVISVLNEFGRSRRGAAASHWLVSSLPVLDHVSSAVSALLDWVARGELDEVAQQRLGPALVRDLTGRRWVLGDSCGSTSQGLTSFTPDRDLKDTILLLWCIGTRARKTEFLRQIAGTAPSLEARIEELRYDIHDSLSDKRWLNAEPFRDADLKGWVAEKIDLEEICLSGASLANARLLSIRSRGTLISGSAEARTDLSHLKVGERMILGPRAGTNPEALDRVEHVILRDLDCADADLTIRNCHLREVDFTAAAIKSLTLDGCILENVKLDQASITELFLTGTDIQASCSGEGLTIGTLTCLSPTVPPIIAAAVTPLSDPD